MSSKALLRIVRTSDCLVKGKIIPSFKLLCDSFIPVQVIQPHPNASCPIYCAPSPDSSVISIQDFGTASPWFDPQVWQFLSKG